MDNAEGIRARADQEAIIRRFDEVLSMKASHVALKTLDDSLNEKITERLDGIMIEVNDAIAALGDVEKKQLA